MSRSAIATWEDRLRKRVGQKTAWLCSCPDHLDAAIDAVAQRLRIDPAVLLGVLAKSSETGLWLEFERALRPETGARLDDWQELAAAAAELSNAAREDGVLSCWVAEAADPADVFAVASCMALAAPRKRLDIVATHSDPFFAEVGRTGLLTDSALRNAPDDNRERHFRHLDRCWQVLPALRARVRFETRSLVPGQDAGPLKSNFHMVICRGLLSRLCADAASRLGTRLLRRLRSGGFLLVGPGEHDLQVFSPLDRHVAPGVLLYRKCSAQAPAEVFEEIDFAELLSAIEAEPMAWEPRWRLGRALLRGGYAEPAVAHLREAARQQPQDAAIWRTLAQAYTLLGDIDAAGAAQRRAASSVAAAA